MRTFSLGIVSGCIAGITLSLACTVGLSQLSLGSLADSLAYRGSGRLETNGNQFGYRGSGRVDTDRLAATPGPRSPISGHAIAHRGSGRITMS